MGWGRGDSGDDWICDNLDIRPTYLGCGSKAKEKNQAKLQVLMMVLVTKMHKLSITYFNHRHYNFISFIYSVSKYKFLKRVLLLKIK